MKTLRECWDEIGQRTDKGPVCHSYLPFYEEVLGPYRETASALLEIGAFHGASLDMWRLFFRPECHIWGVDFNPHILPDQVAAYEDANIHVLLRVDAYTPHTIRLLVDWLRNFGLQGFDVIIDDGSHIEEHQEFVLHEYGKLLNPGGLLVIEDVQPSPPNGPVRRPCPLAP